MSLYKIHKTFLKNSKMFLLRGPKLDKKIPSNEKKIQDFLTSHYEKMQFEK